MAPALSGKEGPAAFPSRLHHLAPRHPPADGSLSDLGAQSSEINRPHDTPRGPPGPAQPIYIHECTEYLYSGHLGTYTCSTITAVKHQALSIKHQIPVERDAGMHKVSLHTSPACHRRSTAEAIQHTTFWNERPRTPSEPRPAPPSSLCPIRPSLPDLRLRGLQTLARYAGMLCSHEPLAASETVALSIP